MKKNKIIGLGLAIAALTLGFTGCSKKTEKKIVRISNFQGYSVPYNTGIDEGIFDRVLKEHGFDNIEIEIINFSKGAETVEAAQAGELDIISCGDQMVTTAIIANGLPYKLIATNYTNTDWAFIASSKSGIKTIADLKGSKYGALLGNNQYLGTLAFIEANGFDPQKDLTFFNLSQADQLTAFTTGEIDWATFAGRNQAEVFRRDPDAVVLGYNGDYKFNECVIAVSDKFGKENHDLVVALVKAFDEATKFAIANPDKALASARRHYDNDDESLKANFKSCNFVIPFDDRILDSIQKTIHYSYTNGIISREADVSEVIDFSYLREAGLYE